MEASIIATKLYVPGPRRGFVARPRLQAKLDLSAGAGLTLVSAPAGFGKTSLLADWVQGAAGERHGRVAWLSLDAAEGEPGTFWSHVITALQTVVPGAGSKALELIGSPPLATELFLVSLINDLAALSQDLWLVLDDYHTVDGGGLADGMSYFLEHVPQQLHVVMSTRSDPDLPLARWRVRGKLVEIRAADLRFSQAEAEAYLNKEAGLGLAPEQVSTLEQRTEGWIAALQLAVLSLRDRNDAAGFINRFAGDDRYVVDYLVDEVLEHQPDGVRSFLQHTAVLDRLTGPLCDAVTGRDGGSTMLVNLERANLFVVPLDDRREWYRYHHLFADVLRGRLLSEEPDQVPLLHRRASQWYESRDHLANAIRHALEGRDFGRAARLVERALPLLRRSRQDAVLFGWLAALPDPTIRESPVLSVFYGAMLMASGDLAGVELRLADAERTLAAAGPAAAEGTGENQELETLPATIATYRASLAQARGDAAGTAAHARRALELAGPTDHMARGAAAAFLGFAAWSDGNVAEALHTFTGAIASLHAAGNLLDEYSSTVILADMLLAAGRPAGARRSCTAALMAADSQSESMLRAGAELHVALAELCREAGDLQEAGVHLAAAAAFYERGPMTESRYRWFVARALTAYDEGRRDRAMDWLDQAGQLYRPGFFPEVRPVPAIKARLQLRHGDLSAAARWAQLCGIDAAGGGTYLQEFNHLTLVRLLIARQRTGADTLAANAALDLLGRLSAGAAETGRFGSLAEIRMLQSLAFDALGLRLQAQEALAESLTGSPEPDGYVRLYLDEGPPMADLLRGAAKAKHDGAAAAGARRLLTLCTYQEPAGARSGEQPESDLEPLSDRELQVLRMLDSDLSGPEIARALFISHNTLRTHTKHIFTKLGVGSRRAAVGQAGERGLL
ncbi:LuxR C-terminal-related transcriptional regulator [Arthrobacter sp. MPF02]|uniref:LuxR C-terminal-related transcriptional regulator n=1 Tax=Arthrobacter sp. MPF02 TaxID=3388492 RepID=UPI003984CB52